MFYNCQKYWHLKFYIKTLKNFKFPGLSPTWCLYTTIQSFTSPFQALCSLHPTDCCLQKEREISYIFHVSRNTFSSSSSSSASSSSPWVHSFNVVLATATAAASLLNHPPNHLKSNCCCAEIEIQKHTEHSRRRCRETRCFNENPPPRPATRTNEDRPSVVVL